MDMQGNAGLASKAAEAAMQEAVKKAQAQAAKGENKGEGVSGKTDSNLVQANFHVKEKDLDLGAMPKPLASEEVIKRAKALLKLTKEQVAAAVPAEVLLGATGAAKQRLLDLHYRMWTTILSAVAEGKVIDFKSDGDGTKHYKNPTMVASTSSQSSMLDKHWHRVLAQSLYFIGSKLGILSARPTEFAGLSMTSAEGQAGYSSSEEISAIVGQNAEIPYSLANPKDRVIANNIVRYGLSGGITSEPGKPLYISEDTKRFIELIKFINKINVPGLEKGFLNKFMEIRNNNGEPIRTAELKAIPRAFTLMPDLQGNQYINYMDLATKSRKEKWSSEKFIGEVEKLKLPLTPKLNAILDPKDPRAEMKLTELMRDGELACFTPHAIDYTNVERTDVRRKLYVALLAATRAPEVQKWANEKYGIPIGADLISINGKSISHIKDFSEKTIPDSEFHSFITELGKTGTHAKKEHTLINVIDNNQFYIEIAPRNTKDEVEPSFAKAISDKLYCIYAGDSGGSDAPAHAQAVINGGLAVVVRGLMGPTDIANKMVELLADPKNAGHPDQMVIVGDEKDNKYALVSNPSDVRSKSQWTEYFAKKYAPQIIQIDNIHLNNAFTAHVFSKLVEGQPGCDFKFNPNADWVKEVQSHAKERTRTLQTPDIGMQELGIVNSLSNKPKKSIEETLSFLTAIPILGPAIKKLVSIDNSRPIFANGVQAIGVGLVGSGAVATVARLSGHEKLFASMDKLQRNIFGFNNLISGIGRGLRNPTLYPLQFLGEMVAFASSRFPSTSFIGKTLFAVANGMLQIGRGNAAIQAENTILDGFKKGTEADVKKVFGEADFKKYGNLRPLAAELTNARTANIKRLKPMMGEFLATALADVKQGLDMAGQFLKVKGFRHGFLTSLFKNSGVTKTSMTSGKDYTNVASVGHAYAASGVLATGLSFLSLALHKAKKESPLLENVLTSVETIASTFGMVTAARHVEQDAHGYPRQFTDTQGRQVQFNPEKSGFLQRLGAQAMAASSLFLGTSVGKDLLTTAVGLNLMGVGEELNPTLEMGAISQKRKEQKYANDSWDMKLKPKEIIEFVKANRGEAANDSNIAAATSETAKKAA